MTTFRDLGVRPELAATLARLGIQHPFPIQRLTIPDGLAGRDVCGKAATGSGKTLAFGLPLLHRTAPAQRPSAPPSLVLVPTRELAQQIVEVLTPLAEEAGLRVRAFYGGADMDRQIRWLRNGVDIAVATPGRLIDLIQRKSFLLDDVSSVVVDEADRMADMGFLPQVDWVLRQVRTAQPQMMLFSATLDNEVDVLVHRYLHDPVRHEVVSDAPTLEEMTHRFLAVHEMDRVRVVAAIARGVSRTLVFARTKRGVDRLMRELAREGVRVGAIHGDLPQRARERALARLVDGDLQALIATDVAARGIHIDDIDVVLHFDPPDDPKGYLHRSGRTARAGRAGTVVTFVLWNQVYDVQRMQKRLGLDQPIVEVFSNDPRLADMAAWDDADDRAAS